MTASAAGRAMTAEELLRLSIPGRRHELVEGIVVEMEPPGAEHSIIAAEIAGLLRDHVRPRGLGTVFGEGGFLLATGPDTVLAPDAAFVARERAEPVGRTKQYFPGPPDLAVEVVSFNDRPRKVHEKALRWIAFGARVVLVVDPDPRTVTVYRPEAEPQVATGDERLDVDVAVPGWAPTVADLFA